MRTTLTIDDDLMARLKEETHRRRVPFRDVVNDALRRALSAGRPLAGKAFKLKTYPSRLRPGYDPSGFNRLADELEDEGLARQLRQRRTR